jgi:hypothetical protein
LSVAVNPLIPTAIFSNAFFLSVLATAQYFLFALEIPFVGA